MQIPAEAGPASPIVDVTLREEYEVFGCGNRSSSEADRPLDRSSMLGMPAEMEEM
jgi:hypothetical protein